MSFLESRLARLVEEDSPDGSNLFVDELGYVFDSDFFSYAEDLDFGLRVHALGYRTVIVPGAVVCHLHTLPD